MKNRALSYTVMLLSALFFFGQQAYAQTRDIQRDLEVEFSGEYSGMADPGVVFGKVTNKSANSYACVRLEFILGTRIDHARAGEPNRQASAFVVEVQNILPRSVREYRKALPLPSSIGFTSKSECAAQPDGGAPSQEVTLYDDSGFGGRSRSFGLGSHRLFSPADFNDLASSIKVPADLVVIVYEHADEGGGHGRYVDFLEDQPNLARYNFDNQISYLKILKRRSENRGITFYWARNSFQDGAFKEGHYKNVRRGERPPDNPNPLIGPAKPPNIATPPPPPTSCTILGQISGPLTFSFTDDRGQPQTATLRQVVMESDDGQRVYTRLQGRNYTFTNVPSGKAYKIFPDHFRATPRERTVMCQSNTTHGDQNFRLLGAPPSG